MGTESCTDTYADDTPGQKRIKSFKEACWDTHVQKGMKKKGNKMVPNCVPKNEDLDEVSPPGFEGTVKAMKKHKEVDNPYALAWYMKNKGYKSHKKKDGSDKDKK